MVDEIMHFVAPDDVNSTLLHSSPEPRVHSNMFGFLLSRVPGVVLLYDITSFKSFDDLTTKAYWALFRHRAEETYDGVPYPCGRQRFGAVLVGNKKDIIVAEPAKREVDAGMAREWAESQGMKFFEVSAYDKEGIDKIIEEVVRDAERKEKRDEEDLRGGREMMVSRGKRVVQGLGGVLRGVLPRSS